MCHGVGVLAAESPGSNTNPKYDGTDDLFLIFDQIGKANDVYGRPRDPHGIQEVANLRTQVLPDSVEFVAEDWAELLPLAIGLDFIARLRPRRGARGYARIIGDCLQLGHGRVGVIEWHDGSFKRYVGLFAASFYIKLFTFVYERSETQRSGRVRCAQCPQATR